MSNTPPPSPPSANAAPRPPTPPRRPGGMFGGRGGPGMAMPVEKAQNFSVSGRRLLGRLLPERTRILSVLSLTVIGVVLNVLVPRVMGHATDLIFSGFIGSRFTAGVDKAGAIAHLNQTGNHSLADTLRHTHFIPGVGIDYSALERTLLLAILLVIGGAVFGALQGLLLNGVVARTVYRLRSDVEDKLNRLPLSYFDTRTRGEVLSRVTNDIDNIQQSLQQTMSQSINSLLMVVGVLVMMFLTSPLLALVGLISVPLSLLVTARIAKRSQKLFIAQWAGTGELNGHIEEVYTGHTLVKVFGRGPEVEHEFADRNEKLFKASYGAQFVSGIIMPALFFIGNLNYVLLAVVGGLRVSSGAMTVGSVQAIIQYARQFTQPLTQLASMANLLQSGVASAERVFEFLDGDELSAEPLQPAHVDTPQGRVEFEHVSFSYKPDVPLIEDLSFVANPGQTVAIVGHTGAGKTTLVNLIMRFYEINAGRITIDGVNTADMSRQELRSRIGMVLQDAWLFGGSIRDNIAYGRLDATEDDILEAAKATFVDRFVRVLPDGYDTVIDNDGTNISAGEKQLLTIARAFLSNPALLILDEATSSVDTRTEVMVQHAMAALRSERTSFVIAHRLSTIRDADLILVMDSGRIVEQGTHQDLLAARGAYFDLYNSQFTEPSADVA
jgi:ATP-binding cassette, subfamily B, multidrug efflux pump